MIFVEIKSAATSRSGRNAIDAQSQRGGPHCRRLPVLWFWFLELNRQQPCLQLDRRFADILAISLKQDKPHPISRRARPAAAGANVLARPCNAMVNFAIEAANPTRR
jgi:hypothetical protein